MVETERLEDLQRIFAGELDERLSALNHWMLRLERGGAGPDGTEAFEALLREAHSLKGAARAVDANGIERLAHALEASFDAARRGAAAPTGAWFDTVYRALDLFVPLARGSEGESAADVDSLLAALREMPSTAEPGLDAVLDQPTDRAPAAAINYDRPAEHGFAIAIDPDSNSPSTWPPPNSSGGTAAASTVGAGVRADAESVRVGVAKLDSLLAQAGELAVTRIRIEQRVSEVREMNRSLELWRREWRAAQALRVGVARRLANLPPEDQELAREIHALLRFSDGAYQRAQAVCARMGEVGANLGHDTGQLSVVSRAIENGVMAARLLPLSTLVGPLERLVRDLGRATGKQVELVVNGAEIEIDRRVLEQLRDPLMHMLRNAVDHGIEDPEERRRCGKPEKGAIVISVVPRASAIELEVRDDGAGLDPADLRKSAVRRGLLDEARAAALDDDAAFELIFLPGFSTSQSVTEISGRGVGLDVVREHIEKLDGLLRVLSTRGIGTRFRITVPLTVATTRVLLVEVASQLLAVPTAGVERNARVRPSALRSVEGKLSVEIDGQAVPVLELSALLDLSRDVSPGLDDWQPFFVLRARGRRFGLLVHRLVGEQEIVAKRLAWPLVRVRNVAGVATLGSGQTVVILNTGDLVKGALRMIDSGHATATSARQEVAAGEPPRRRLLVVDDSITTRTLMRSILEAAGFDVAVAIDGMDALPILRAGEIDLLVSDVEMPRMDGFALTAEVRRDEGLKNLPVILVTSLEKPEHKERGVAVGADAYIEKSGFDQQQLIDTVTRLLA